MHILCKLVLLLVVGIVYSGEPKACIRPHEVYQCGNPCQVTCQNLGQSCTETSDPCIDSCYCEDGYARDSSGTCISIDLCATRTNGVCGKFEEFRNDLYINNECYVQLLSEIPYTYNCGCYCIAGYKRDSTGSCVPELDCPPLPDPSNKF